MTDKSNNNIPSLASLHENGGKSLHELKSEIGEIKNSLKEVFHTSIPYADDLTKTSEKTEKVTPLYSIDMGMKAQELNKNNLSLVNLIPVLSMQCVAHPLLYEDKEFSSTIGAKFLYMGYYYNLGADLGISKTFETKKDDLITLNSGIGYSADLLPNVNFGDAVNKYTTYKPTQELADSPHGLNLHASVLVKHKDFFLEGNIYSPRFKEINFEYKNEDTDLVDHGTITYNNPGMWQAKIAYDITGVFLKNKYKRILESGHIPKTNPNIFFSVAAPFQGHEISIAGESTTIGPNGSSSHEYSGSVKAKPTPVFSFGIMLTPYIEK